MADFDEKLRKMNNKVTSNKIRDIEAEEKLNDRITSFAKRINDLIGRG